MTLLPTIDEGGCCGHGDCVYAAPQAFALEGDMATVIGTAPDDVLLEAARACPSGAIVLTDAATGEEVAY